jgi:hypothetical protein
MVRRTRAVDRFMRLLLSFGFSRRKGAVLVRVKPPRACGGLIEPTEPDATGAPERQVIKLAGWGDRSRMTLAPQQAETTEIVVVLGREGDA